MENKVRTIIIDGVEIQTSLSAIEIADLPIKNADLQQRIDKAIDTLYCWGEVLDPEFQDKMLNILLKGDSGVN